MHVAGRNTSRLFRIFALELQLFIAQRSTPLRFCKISHWSVVYKSRTLSFSSLCTVWIACKRESIRLRGSQSKNLQMLRQAQDPWAIRIDLPCQLCPGIKLSFWFEVAPAKNNSWSWITWIAEFGCHPALAANAWWRWDSRYRASNCTRNIDHYQAVPCMMILPRFSSRCCVQSAATNKSYDTRVTFNIQSRGIPAPCLWIFPCLPAHLPASEIPVDGHRKEGR